MDTLLWTLMLFCAAFAAGSPRNCPDAYFACPSGRCIPEYWVCDGTNDCHDHGSDEQHCGRNTTPTPVARHSCASDEFACISNRHYTNGCIPRRWVCDGDHEDCIDDSDEQNCGIRQPCPSDHFACESGRCIPNSWVCDGANDCHDGGSDERNCSTNMILVTTTPIVLQRHCPNNEFACRSHRRTSGCIPLRWVCDGDYNDCIDGLDERHCGSPRTCPEGFFSCDSGQCIPNNWVCDGANDCYNSDSDERHCHTTTTTQTAYTYYGAQNHCTANEFACRSPRRSNGCIPRSWVCDHDRGDCYDGSDERDCAAQQQCAADEFACTSNRRSSGCIPRSWVCDGDHRDCVDDSDERNCGSNATDPTSAPLAPATVPQAACSQEQFSCASRRWRGGCVPLVTVCDARAGDCDDGSDETHCGAVRACPDRWFACASGRCVPPAMVCDGRLQCADGADERQCGDNSAVDVTVPQTTGRIEAAGAAQAEVLRLELPSGLDQDAHFALSLAHMLRARAPRDKLDAQMAVLRLFRELARN